MEKREEEIHRLSRSATRQARELADKCPVPKNLRPAKAEDIVVDAILWYPHWEDAKWCIVEEVLNPNCDFKAFNSGGCRYGLHRAFIEIIDDTRRVNVYRFEVLFIDHDEWGIDAAKSEIESIDRTSVMSSQGESVVWDDSHPLNITGKQYEAFKALFILGEAKA